jgi:hypothetical protein
MSACDFGALSFLERKFMPTIPYQESDSGKRPKPLP